MGWESACSKTAACKAYTFFRDNYATWAHNCFLRADLGQKSAMTSASSGTKGYSYEIGTSYETENVAEFKLKTQELCEDKCEANTACAAYTFWPGRILNGRTQRKFDEY